MSTHARMIILPLSFVLHYFLTKMSDLTFIGVFPSADTNGYKAVINGYNSYTCSDSEIVTVRPQKLPLRRYFPVRTNGHTQVV